jgi:hypothetical protein
MEMSVKELEAIDWESLEGEFESFSKLPAL